MPEADAPRWQEAAQQQGALAPGPDTGCKPAPYSVRWNYSPSTHLGKEVNFSCSASSPVRGG